jgi:DNA-binding NtrC family response regulator
MNVHPAKPPLRVVLCACGTSGAETLGEILEAEGAVTVRCSSHESLLEELVRHPVDGIVFGFAPPCSAEPALLRMVRRLHPETPLVIVAHDASLELERMFREYRPLFVAVPPWERSELRDVVRAFRAHRARKNVAAASQP